jgi:hypothetical protein
VGAADSSGAIEGLDSIVTDGLGDGVPVGSADDAALGAVEGLMDAAGLGVADGPRSAWGNWTTITWSPASTPFAMATA